MNVVGMVSNQFFKSSVAKVLSEYFNNEESKLCDIIEERCVDMSVESRKLILDYCESAIPLMIKLETIKEN